jgi:tRNA A37 threonylcarbamoyltransferase TsaD
LGGGVGCNKRLQEMAHIMCKERGAKCYVPPNSVLVDNGLMIAWQGIIEYKAGTRMKIEDTKVFPYLRTDDVIVNWRD